MNTQEKIKSENRLNTICNKCGKELAVQDDMLREGVAVMETDWGYFSNKDGEHHRFCLCEDCYDKMIADFAVPVEVVEKTELL